jgi:phosphoglycolate phosphatase
VRPFRLLILDYDGTLADSGQWFADNLNRFAKRHGFRSVTPDEIETLRGMPTREVIRHLKVRPWKLPSIARDMRRAVAEPGGKPELFPGIGEFLSRAQAAGITIAVVSSNTELNIRVGLGETNAARVTAFDCGASLFGKAGKLRRLARRFGVPGSEVLCVGDDSRDVDAARKAGLKVAAVSWGYANEQALRSASPDYVVHSIDELSAILGL